MTSGFLQDRLRDTVLIIKHVCKIRIGYNLWHFEFLTECSVYCTNMFLLYLFGFF